MNFFATRIITTVPTPSIADNKLNDFISPAICVRSFIASPVPALPPNSFAVCIRIIVTPIPLINPPITGVDM